MTDQIFIMNKLNKWFWYFGVLPLVISYLMCLNFVAELIQIHLTSNPSITLFYMGELLFFITLGLVTIMVLWCNINAFRVNRISSEITSSELKFKKYVYNTSVYLCPIIAILSFIPLLKLVLDKGFYLPLFPIIEPIAQSLTPYLFPIYLFIVNVVRYTFGTLSYFY
jgi:hypothetical protein